MNNVNVFILKHKNIDCGIITIDKITGSLINAVIDSKHAPFLGNATLDKLKIWWECRAIPGSRNTIDKILKEVNCDTSKLYLAKNLALSFTDCYWICPNELNLQWEDVNLWQQITTNDLSKISYNTKNSYDPNASLSGQMDKYWDCDNNPPRLIKKAYKYYGQQAINEEFASYIYKGQNNDIKFVNYDSYNLNDNGVACICDAFTNENIEFISMYEIVESQKLRNDISIYDTIINISEEQGINRQNIQESLDYLTSMNFIISNSDNHLFNKGIIRNPDNLQFISMAPIFDNGNSMFFEDEPLIKYNRHEILLRKITDIHSLEEKMLKHIKYKDIIDTNKLPKKEYVFEFYKNKGIPENRANIIAENYNIKVTLFKEFQRDIIISAYNEKQQLNQVKESSATIIVNPNCLVEPPEGLTDKKRSDPGHGE